MNIRFPFFHLNVQEKNCWDTQRKWSCSVVSDSLWPHGLQPTRLLCPWDCPGKSTGVGCHFLLQRIFLTQTSSKRTWLLKKLMKCFPRCLFPYASPQAVPGVSSCFVSSPTFAITSVSKKCHCNECLVVSHHGFDCFTNINGVGHLFMSLFFTCILPLEKYLFESFALFLNWFDPFLFSFKSFLYVYFAYTSFTRFMFCKHFLPISGLHFCFLYSIFQRETFSNLDEV